MGIKLKIRNKKNIKIFLGCLIVIICICFTIFYLVDDVWNGRFVDWFEHNYMITEYNYIPEAEQDGVVRRIQWDSLKSFLMGCFVFGCIVWIITIFIAIHLSAKFNMQKTVTAVSKMISRYMMQEKQASEIFPKEFSEISTQMAEIKGEMQKHEQILKDETERKNDLIAYLAHDLRTPLTSIIGYMNLLREVTDMPIDQREKYINIILKKAYQLEKFVNEFFEISRFNLQQIDIEKEDVDLSYMLYQMADEFYPLLQEHGNTINLRVADNEKLFGDPNRLARVFNNILKNAIAYSYKKTEIQVWVEKGDLRTNIYFRNHGKTIPVKKLDSIFEKFFRVDDAREENMGGAGLGLAIAKEIVALHGGEINAESKDEITTFCVSLP